jgi:hypothetical protein
MFLNRVSSFFLDLFVDGDGIGGYQKERHVSRPPHPMISFNDSSKER